MPTDDEGKELEALTADAEQKAIFVRVTPKEKALIERAVELHYGKVWGNVSEFGRQAMLLLARKIVQKAMKDRGPQ